MNHIKKIAIACTALSSTFVLLTPSASANDECFAGTNCTQSMLDRFAPENAAVWMSSGDVLGDDEEYVPGYEAEGSPICVAPGESLGEGYYAATCMASLQRGFILVANLQTGKKQQRKKKKTGGCAQKPTSNGYGLLEGYVGDWSWTEATKSGCGFKVKNGQLTTTPCGPTAGTQSMNPDCLEQTNPLTPR